MVYYVIVFLSFLELLHRLTRSDKSFFFFTIIKYRQDRCINKNVVIHRNTLGHATLNSWSCGQWNHEQYARHTLLKF